MILLLALDTESHTVDQILEDILRLFELPSNGFERGTVHEALRGLVNDGKIWIEVNEGAADKDGVIHLTPVGRETLERSTLLRTIVSHSWKLTTKK